MKIKILLHFNCSLRKMPPRFKEEDKIKILLWCDRHCCLCGKQCGTDIIVHHIEAEGENLSDIDNAIPLCLQCHGKIKSYDPKHPWGTKYKIKEIKARRNQIYEKYTRHLVPPLLWYLLPRSGDRRKSPLELPRIVIAIENHSLILLPIKLQVMVRAFLGGEEIDVKTNPKKPYYNKGIIWNLNAGHIFFGNFSLDEKRISNKEHLLVEVKVNAIDSYQRSHELLPNCYTYDRKKKSWFTEPTSFNELKKYMYPNK